MPPLVEPLGRDLSAYQVFRCLEGWPHRVFFDSAHVGGKLGRYSFVSAAPFEVIRSRGGVIDGWATPQDPLAVLASRLEPLALDALPDLPPFQGGAAGLFGYDLCHHLERLPRPRFDEFETPDLAVGLYDWVAAFDHEKQEGWLISTGLPAQEPVRRRQRAAKRLRQVREALLHRQRPSAESAQTRPLSATQLAPQWPIAGFSDLSSNFSREAYLHAVRRAIEYVYAGDVFQVNLSQRFLFPANVTPALLYDRLRERNPAPFAGYFDLGDFVVASASPERFLHVQGDAVETRPIKGTRRRGLTPEADLFSRDALAHSEKDVAENVMIVDLLRNDLGRVCRPGSVQVPQVCQVEVFRYVYHLVSEVRGRLREGLGPIDLLRAAFPGGSVTGAPKVRACQIIAELEPTARGPYCGCLAYLGFNGAMDSNLLIRTATLGRGWMQFPAGGGIVAQSVPEQEYEETLDKAAGIVRALA